MVRPEVRDRRARIQRTSAKISQVESTNKLLAPRYARPRTYSPRLRSQSGMENPVASSLERSRAEWAGRGATGPSAPA